MSEAALAEAHSYLAGFPGLITLRHGDLLAAIGSTDKTWDVIFSGFAVHHLMFDEKVRFLRAAGRCLAENGWLILVDVVREESQSRENYLEGYLEFMRENGIKVPQEQLREMCAHVHDYDYPECLSILQEMTSAASLNADCIISRYGQHYALLFTHSSPPEICC